MATIFYESNDVLHWFDIADENEAPIMVEQLNNERTEEEVKDGVRYCWRTQTILPDFFDNIV